MAAIRTEFRRIGLVGKEHKNEFVVALVQLLQKNRNLCCVLFMFRPPFLARWRFPVIGSISLLGKIIAFDWASAAKLPRCLRPKRLWHYNLFSGCIADRSFLQGLGANARFRAKDIQGLEDHYVDSIAMHFDFVDDEVHVYSTEQGSPIAEAFVEGLNENRTKERA